MLHYYPDKSLVGVDIHIHQIDDNLEHQGHYKLLLHKHMAMLPDNLLLVDLGKLQQLVVEVEGVELEYQELVLESELVEGLAEESELVLEEHNNNYN